MADKGLTVIGIDISDRCVEMAEALNPQMRFVREDMLDLSFAAETFDGVIAYYSIIHTPKAAVGRFFREFHRVLKPNVRLLLAVKTGSSEGYVQEIIGIQAEIYFSLFDENEIRGYFEEAGFAAARSGETTFLGLLIDKGVDPDAGNIYGWTPLHVAAFLGHQKMIEALLRNGADMRIRTKDGKIRPDGKIFFFVQNITPYWVDASFIEDLRKEALKDDK